MPSAIRIPSLRLQDIDGSPDIQGVERIYLTNGFLSDMGGGSALLSLSGTASGGGAPTTSEYVTTAADGTLSNEVNIPGLAGSADKAGVGGAGTSEEYDTSTTGLTWSPSNPNLAIDSDTTRLSHLYASSDDNTERFGTKSWAPGSGAFDARARVSMANSTSTVIAGWGMYIANSDDSTRTISVLTNVSESFQIRVYTYSGGYTQRGATQNISSNTIFQRITRDGSNNISFYYSHDGYAWQFIATQALTFTVAKIGFRIADTGGAATTVGFADWLRTNV